MEKYLEATGFQKELIKRVIKLNQLDYQELFEKVFPGRLIQCGTALDSISYKDAITVIRYTNKNYGSSVFATLCKMAVLGLVIYLIILL